MIRVGIVGGSGYTGIELVRILSSHPGVEITVVTSRSNAGLPLERVFPSLKGRTTVVFEDVKVDELKDRADVFFTAVPHKTAMAIVPALLENGKKVIDLSADFRLRQVATYEEWYQKHTAPQYLAEAVYGLPELYRDKIKNARLVANPGCYPTSIILGLAPLLEAGILDLATLIADSKSGASGAGRAAQTGMLFCEVTDGFRAYKVGEHRHTPEIEQELSLLAGRELLISFTPHLLPMSRGILSTIYAHLREPVQEDIIKELYLKRYSREPFVRLCDPGVFPATQYVRGSNFCDIGFKLDRRTGRIVILAALDNIVKGASGQAVQNMNLLCGLPETQGLATAPLFP